MCIGGPALIYYVTPTEEELFMVTFPPPSKQISDANEDYSDIIQNSSGAR